MTRILVIEDNQDLLEELCFQLRHHQHDVLGLPDGSTLETALANFAPQLLLLDLGLPGEDGLSIAARMRQQHPQLGIVMLTARTQLHERLLGHDQGADHYLCKPVELAELLAVIASLSRRLPDQAAPPWQLRRADSSLLCPQGKTISLSHNESLLLHCLQQAAEHQTSREELIRALGEDPYLYDERRLEAMISRLRRKISQASGTECPLKAWRNKGYSFSARLHNGA